MHNIMIVEDDLALANGICLALQSHNMTVTVCHDIQSARHNLANKIYHLLILDINLPDGNGLDFLNELKKQSNLTIIILTANDLETDIVAGLEMGADDYITKPFSLAILRARVNTQLRKQDIHNVTQFIQDEFLFDFNSMFYLKNKMEIDLSKTEQKLLKILVDNRGITVTRDTLIEHIWSNNTDYVDENTLSVTLKRLRNKLEDDPTKPVYIKTVYGIGYVWVVR